MLMQSLQALRTQTPVHQTALKVRRYIGLICDGCHGDTMDKVTYYQPTTKPRVPCDRWYLCGNFVALKIVSKIK